MHQLDRLFESGQREQAAQHCVRVRQLNQAARALRGVRYIDDRAQAVRVDELELVEIEDQVLRIVEIRDGAAEAGDGGAVELARDGQAHPIATRLPQLAVEGGECFDRATLGTVAGSRHSFLRNIRYEGAVSEELASLDGVTAPALETSVPITDEGFLRGDGAFEVVRVYAGVPFLLDEHLDRMEGSASNLRLEGGLQRKEFEREARDLLEKRDPNGFDGCLRLVQTRAGHRLLITEPLPQPPERLRCAFVTYAPTRVLDGVKSLSYAANMLCTRIAQERGFHEALLVTPHGRVLEAPTSSLFWVDGERRLCTPPLDDHILASITRAHLLELLEVDERSVTKEELLEAQEAFIASTTREVHSISAIEEREFPETGEVTRKAAAAFRAHVENLLA